MKWARVDSRLLLLDHREGAREVQKQEIESRAFAMVREKTLRHAL